MITFILLLSLLPYACAQYPYLKESESAVFGQCKTDADCGIYVTVYPMHPASFFFCNEQVGRCSTTDGDLLNPAFNVSCPNIVMTSISYRSLDGNVSRADGMIIVNITAPGYIYGSMRLFSGTQSNTTNETTIEQPYHEEQYVNYPNTVMYFRNVPPNFYTIRFIDRSGCIVTHYPPRVRIAFDNVYFPFAAGLNFWESTGTEFLQGPARFRPMRTPNSAAFGRGIRVGLNYTEWNGYIHTDPILDIGEGQRVPYAHIYDISGGLLSTRWGNDVLWTSSFSTVVNGTTTWALGGITFPLNADTNAQIIRTQREAMLLSGFVSVVIGIGYAYRDCSLCNITFIQDSNGDFEGAIWPTILVNLSTTTFMNGTIDDFDVPPMHFTLEGIFTNTRFMYSDFNIFPNTTTLSTRPSTRILHTGTNQTVSVNSLCINGSVTGATIYLDYTGYAFVNNPLLFDVFKVVMSESSGLTLVLDPFSVPQSVVAVPMKFYINSPGFYCIVLRANLLDGRGIRPLLQTCFQVGVAEAPLTQTRSRIVPLDDIHYPYTTYAGLYPNISSTFIVGLPTTLVVEAGMVPYVVLTRFANNQRDDDNIINSWGRNIDVFNDPLATLDIREFYLISAVGPFYLYTLNVNPSALAHQFEASFQTATSLRNEVAISKLFIVSTEPAPEDRPFNLGRRAPEVEEEARFDEEFENVERIGRRRLMAMTQSQSPSPSQSQSQTPEIDFGDYDGGDNTGGGANPIVFGTGITVQYICNLPTLVNMIEYAHLSCVISVENAVCPAERSIMSVVCTGGHPFAMDNNVFSNPVYVNGSSSHPHTNPVAYFVRFINEDAGVNGRILKSGVGVNEFETPQNIEICAEVIDAANARTYSCATSFSIIPESAQIIFTLPQIPQCRDGRQFVLIPFYFLNNDPNNVIVIAPEDQTKNNLYDPNIPTFDLPANCTLLQWFNEFEVYSICVSGDIINATALAQCTGCTNLPKAYAKAPILRAGNSSGSADPYYITTAAAAEWWTITIWTITDIYDNVTQRFVYCQTQLTVSSFIPRPLSLTFQSVQRIPSPPLCLGPDCFRVKILPLVDPCYASQSPNPEDACYQGVDYSGSVITIADPFMEYLGSDFYRVTINQFYNLTSFIAGAFCPVNSGYIPMIRGPIIVNIIASRSNCGQPDGSVIFFLSYIDPTFAFQNQPAKLCMLWRDRRSPPFQVADSVPLQFEIPTNPIQSVLIPNEFFVENQRFTGIRAGLHNVMFYERCPDTTCTSCLIPNTYQLTNPNLAFAYQEFTVDNFLDPAGGIVIERFNFTPAACFGDTHVIEYNFYDNSPDITGLPVQKYEVILLNPFDLGVRVMFAGCLPGNPILPAPTPFGDTQVKWGPFHVEIPTGGNEGLGISGNYTFQVRGCTSGCVETFPTYIDAPQPFVIHLSSAGTDCAYRPAQLVPQVSGPPGFGPDDNVSLTYIFPGGILIHNSPYLFCWYTPLNPFVCTSQFLQFDVIPGNYTLRACAPGNCCAQESVIVQSAPAIECSIVGYNEVCQTSNSTEILFNCTGGTPPYRVLENVTAVSDNTTISLTFVSGFNRTSCFNIIDASDCIRPTKLCFEVPDPGPLNITVTKRDSCVNTATGSILVTSDEPIQCSWLVTGGTTPLISSCSLTNLPITASVVMTARNIIGCTAQQVIKINTRPPLEAELTGRSKTGVLDGPCVDNITATVFGGLDGAPYLISLYNDITNATLSVVYGNLTEVVINSTGVNGTNITYMNVTIEDVAFVTITGVCRSFIYTILIIENDGVCATTLLSTDPEFSFGGGGAGGLMGMDPPNEGEFGKPTNPNFILPKYSKNIAWELIPVIVVCFWFLIAMTTISHYW